MESFTICALSLGLFCSEVAPTNEAPLLPLSVAPGTVTQHVAAPTPELATSASAVLASVQAFYDGTTDLACKFKQTYVHPVYGSRTISSGDLRLKKPGMMVWDYEGKAVPDFYVDGRKLWVVEHDTRQVVSQKIEGNSSLTGAMKFLFGGERLIKEFAVKLAPDKLARTYAMPGHKVLLLKPKVQNPHYTSLLLVVDELTGRVDSFVVRAPDKSTNHFVLTDVRKNLNPATADFKYLVPKGYVETRQ